MTKLACAADEIITLAPGEVQAILDKDKKGEFLLLERPGKNNWRRSSYG
ncbi:MAG: hypothetical protein WBE46_05870 [Dehalococcoidia bacterium]